MPYSAIPDPLPELGFQSYQLSVSIEDFPGTAFTNMSLEMSPGGMPTDQPITAAMDEWFQALVDAIATVPHVSSIYAAKGSSIGVSQEVTPTEPE